MKKKICIILALILLLPTILLVYGSNLPEYYGETYYAELAELYNRLKTTQGRKIVIIGGSSVAFGTDSAQIENTLAFSGFDHTVCNFGLYAAVGTSAMLELSEDYIGAGDIVVLAIEPSSETFSTYFGATAMLKCAESTPEMLMEFGKTKASAMLGNYIGYLQERAQIQRTGILPKGEGVYAKSSFDENGDLRYKREGNAMLLGYDTANPIDLASVVFEPAFVEQVNNYIDTVQKRGATVVISFAPMNKGAMVDASEEVVYDFFCRLQDTFHATIISNPNNYIMDSGWFYDTNFHLNTAGMKVRSYQLVCDLLNYLGYYKQVPFEMPKMPDSIAKVEENEADASDFTFEAVGENGLVVTGLTDSGKGKSVLMVPSSYNGKPVVEIAATAFAGNTTLTELVLPSSISGIADGAFSGCSNLTRLTLLHRDTTPTVGEGLLTGAPKVTIYVPSDAYHLYRDGAGCATNAWEQYLDRIQQY